jgi:hypothetical protein
MIGKLTKQERAQQKLDLHASKFDNLFLAGQRNILKFQVKKLKFQTQQFQIRKDLYKIKDDALFKQKLLTTALQNENKVKEKTLTKNELVNEDVAAVVQKDTQPTDENVSTTVQDEPMPAQTLEKKKSKLEDTKTDLEKQKEQLEGDKLQHAEDVAAHEAATQTLADAQAKVQKDKAIQEKQAAKNASAKQKLKDSKDILAAHSAHLDSLQGVLNLCGNYLKRLEGNLSEQNVQLVYLYYLSIFVLHLHF